VYQLHPPAHAEQRASWAWPAQELHASYWGTGDANGSLRESKASPAQHLPAFHQPAGLGPSACLTAAQHGEQSTSLVPESSSSLICRHKLHRLIKEDTHHTAFMSSRWQLSKVAAMRSWKGPALAGGQYQIPSPDHRKHMWKCLRGVRCSSYPVCSACVFVWQLEMEEDDSVPSATENRNICP